jgi:hypothetical protein
MCRYLYLVVRYVLSHTRTTRHYCRLFLLSVGKKTARPINHRSRALRSSLYTSPLSLPERRCL